MSIDVKDHRKFLEGKAKALEAEARPVMPLLKQIEIAKETGDPRLDKMLRAIGALIEEKDAHSIQVALKAVGCVQDDMIRLQQFEFFYTKGWLDALKATAALPAQILTEEMSLSPR